MTCYYTQTHWRDSLYNAIRATDGGVEGAADFLTRRRGKAMHHQSLRRKLRGEDGMDIEVVLLLGEYVSTDAKACGQSKSWLLSLCAQEDICVDDVPPAPEGGWECEARALQDKFLSISAHIGKIAAVTAETTSDGVIDQSEADQLIPLFRAARVTLHRMERNTRRAALKGRDQ